MVILFAPFALFAADYCMQLNILFLTGQKFVSSLLHASGHLQRFLPRITQTAQICY